MNEDALQSTLLRLTQGLPRRELQAIVNEATECEALLEKDIEALEAALTNPDANVDAIVDSILTPMDRYWTASALLGRLRGDLSIPRIPTAGTLAPGLLPPPKVPPPPEDPMALLAFAKHPNYDMKHDNPASLLTLHKKIASHRSAMVFKRPVKPEEAPGYTDRILFPMDLSLVRKMIVAATITTYREFHCAIALIAHNCLTFNGRESDYAMVAREFEAFCDDAIRQAVTAVPRKSPPPMTAEMAGVSAPAAPPPSAEAPSSTAVTTGQPSSGS